MLRQAWMTYSFYFSTLAIYGTCQKQYNSSPAVKSLFDPMWMEISKSIQSQFHCPLATNQPFEPLHQGKSLSGLFSLNWNTLKSKKVEDRYLNSIRRSVSCIIGLVFGSNRHEFGLAVNLTERIPDSKLIAMGTSHELIQQIKRQVMVLEYDPVAGNVKVNVYCGRRTGAYWNSTVDIWKPEKGFVQDLTWDLYCHHILYRQKFIAGHSGVNPMVILPRNPGDVLRGIEVNAVKLLGQKYDLDLEFMHGEMEVTNTDLNYSQAILGQLFRDEIDLALNVILHIDGYTIFETTTYTHILDLKYCMRRPQKLVDFGNLSRGFDFWSWIFIFATLTLFSGTFAIIYHVYSTHIRRKSLYKEPGNPVDFFLLTFTAIVEPDPLTWFPSWSSGRGVFLLWSLFAFFVTSFFNSNLRSNLIAPVLEPKIETTDDFLNSGRDLFLFNMLSFLLKQKSGTSFQRFLDYIEDHPESIHSLDDDLAAITEKTAVEGAVFISPIDSEMTSYPLNPKRYGLPNRVFSRESLFTGFMANRFRKYSPYVSHLNAVIERYRESGLNQKALYEKLPLVALPGQYQPDQNDIEIRMSLDMLWMALFILWGGIILGLVAFVIEVGVARRKRVNMLFLPTLPPN